MQASRRTSTYIIDIPKHGAVQQIAAQTTSSASCYQPSCRYHLPIGRLPSFMYFRLLQKCCSDLTFYILNNQTISCLLTHLLFSDLYSAVGVSSPYGYFHICSITAKMQSVKRSNRFSSKRRETSQKIV